MSKASYLTPAKLADLAWDPQNVNGSLKQVHDHVVSDAESALQWYSDSRVPKRAIGLVIRFMAVVLVSLGGLLPMIGAVMSEANAPKPALNPLYASLAIGAAAALVGLDRYFGWSKAWMRFVAASMEIRSALEAFEIDWTSKQAALAGATPTQEQITQILELCKTFANKLNDIVASETNKWITDFQASLNDLSTAVKDAQTEAKTRADAAETEAKAKADASKPGAIAITLAGRDKVKGSWKIRLDGADPTEHTGTTAAISSVAPGLRKVQVFMTVGDREVSEEQVVTVAAGGVAKADFTAT